MANVLEFALGLTTGGFIANLGSADSKLKAFLGSMLGLEAIAEGVWKQIEKGSQLRDLSLRTGETAGNLYSLEKGFKAVGVSAEALPMILMQMQKSLGGFNEMGMPTKDIFAGIGLSVDGLKGKKAPQQVLAILEALRSLNKEEATKASSSIFGRAGAGDALQAARGVEEFAKGMQKAAGMAALFDRSAVAFDHVVKSVEALKGKLNPLFAGIAEGIVPALERAANLTSKIDLSGVGRGIGQYLSAMIKVFEQGNLSGFIGESLAIGLETFVAVAPGILQKLGTLLLRIFETPLTYLQAGLQYVIEQAVNNPTLRKVLGLGTSGASERVFAALGLEKSGADSFADILKGTKLSFFKEGMGLNELDKAADDATKDGLAKMKDRLTEWWKKIQDLAGGVVNSSESGAGKLSAASTKEKAATASALEKLGFVFNNGNFGLNYAKDTALATKGIHSVVKETHALLRDRLGTGTLVNK